MVVSTELVKCGKGKFTFHNNARIETCPRCGGQINPYQGNNIVQGAIRDRRQQERKEQQEELNKILSFAQPPGSSRFAVIAPIDNELARSKLSKKDIDEVSKVMEFTGVKE